MARKAAPMLAAGRSRGKGLHLSRSEPTTEALCSESGKCVHTTAGNSLVLMFFYCKHKSNVTKIITIQMEFPTSGM
jgi:hypothetical protein